MRTIIYISMSLLFMISILSCQDRKTTTVIYLVRHAEKDLTDKSDNPKLTDEGELRALKLKTIMDSIKLTEIYTTPFQRNIRTVSPTATQQNITIKQYEWHHWHGMLDNILKKGNGHFLICGHGDNLLPMIAYLGIKEKLPPLGKHEYDNLYKVTIQQDTIGLEIIKY